jgi:hypothetical protein
MGHSFFPSVLPYTYKVPDMGPYLGRPRAVAPFAMRPCVQWCLLRLIGLTFCLLFWVKFVTSPGVEDVWVFFLNVVQVCILFQRVKHAQRLTSHPSRATERFFFTWAFVFSKKQITDRSLIPRVSQEELGLNPLARVKNIARRRSSSDHRCRATRAATRAAPAPVVRHPERRWSHRCYWTSRLVLATSRRRRRPTKGVWPPSSSGYVLINQPQPL